MNKNLIPGILVVAGCLALRAPANDPGPSKGGGSDLVPPAFKPELSVRSENGKRIIDSNGIPDHDVGRFPRRGNPNSIAPQRYHFEVPLSPKVADKPTLLVMQAFGVAVNGIVFDPNAAEWWQGERDWQYEANAGKIDLGLDANGAHVQPTGAYHYHTIPAGLMKNLNPENKPRVTLVGWAADGFPMYARWDYSDPNDAKSAVRGMKSSYRVKSGARPGGPGGKFDGTFLADYEYVSGSGDLDECGGRFGVTPENPEGIYHYVLTDDYPFIPRIYKGTPDASFSVAVRRPEDAAVPEALVVPVVVVDLRPAAARRLRVFRRLRRGERIEMASTFELGLLRLASAFLIEACRESFVSRQGSYSKSGGKPHAVQKRVDPAVRQPKFSFAPL